MNRRSLRAITAFALALYVAAPVAHADMLPGPDTSGCATRDSGDSCILGNGAPGRCTYSTDSRRPGTRYTRCEPIPECSVVPVGGECHAYPGRPAHCREIVDDRTHERHRMCVLDPDSYAQLNDASTAEPPRPSDSGVAAPAPTQSNSHATQPPSAPRSPSRCSVSSTLGSARQGSLALAIAAIAAVASVFAARRRSAALE